VTETTTGYLAPEQISATKKASTRHAAVDAYGLGMTMYFLFTGSNPLVLQHRHADWARSVRQGVRTWKTQWQSMSERIARLIVSCTAEEQAARWDLSQIYGELKRLREAHESPMSVRSAELVAEELLARTNLTEYRWDSDRLAGSIQLASGVEITVGGLESRREVGIRATWTTRGDQKWKSVAKWVPQACEKAQSVLRKSNWENVQQEQSAANIVVSGSAPAERVLTQLDSYAESLRSVATSLELK
jgi:hypothetical protein